MSWSLDDLVNPNMRKQALRQMALKPLVQDPEPIEMSRKYKGKKHTNAIGVVVDGIRFPSAAEGARYKTLKALERAGEISDLELQPKFTLLKGRVLKTNKTKSGHTKIPDISYTPDFKYNENGKVVVEEYKGRKFPAYMMRMKIFLSKLAEFEVDIFREVGSNYTHEWWR